MSRGGAEAAPVVASAASTRVSGLPAVLDERGVRLFTVAGAASCLRLQERPRRTVVA
jgi:hypothetical protein